MIRVNHLYSIQTIFIILALFLCSTPLNAQSPKKLLANGFYEKAFIEAASKQNKKVKLKEKHTSVIYKSYEKIYDKGVTFIASNDYDWQRNYDQLMRVIAYRSKVNHPGVLDNLKNILYDENVLGNLIVKFNTENAKDLETASQREQEGEYFKALDIYNRIKLRQTQAQPITTFKDRLELIDTEKKINQANPKIGDQYIAEANKLLYNGTKDDAKDAIALINKAKSFRPLSREEEEMLTLANLILRDSWMFEAKNLMQTRTKRNGRLAYDLIKKTRSIKALNAEEEKLFQDAKELGMTRVKVVVNGNQPIHTSKTLSGILNKDPFSEWITYYTDETAVGIDFIMEVTERKPLVVLGDVRKKIEQKTKTVEYYEEQIDANGNTIKVKKTKQVTALVAILSRTKSSSVEWTVNLKDLSNDHVVYTEKKASVIERTNQFASLESGDVSAMPDNIESEVSLDSQPFPEDKEMADLANQLYLKEFKIFLKGKEDHLRNIDQVQK